MKKFTRVLLGILVIFIIAGCATKPRFVGLSVNDKNMILTVPPMRIGGEVSGSTYAEHLNTYLKLKKTSADTYFIQGEATTSVNNQTGWNQIDFVILLLDGQTIVDSITAQGFDSVINKSIKLNKSFTTSTTFNGVALYYNLRWYE